MFAYIRNCIQAEKARREENDEKGFSLIELIIVVVILGILAAIAIPIFLNIQDQAKQSSLDAITGNAASQVAATLAQDGTVDLTNLTDGTDPAVELTVSPAGYTIDDFCVTGAQDGKTSTAGPGCPATP